MQGKLHPNVAAWLGSLYPTADHSSVHGLQARTSSTYAATYVTPHHTITCSLPTLAAIRRLLP